MIIQNLLQQLEKYRSNHLLRQRFSIKQRSYNHIEIDQKHLINFCSNDYLGLAHHPDIQKAFIKAAEKFGVGSGASAAVSGFFTAHQEFEEMMAAFLQRDKALFFNSGYHANLAVMSVLGSRDALILSDKLCHASLLDGIILARAKHIRFPHHDTIWIEKFLQKKLPKKTILVTESIFSMEGDITPISHFVNLAQTLGLYLMVDDAHGIGVLGNQGRGVIEHFQLTQQQLPCLITPLGKAFGGAGAVVSGDSDLIEILLQNARSYRYTTALPPAIPAAMQATLCIIQEDTWRREKLKTLIELFVSGAHSRNLPLISADQTPIKSLMIGDNLKTINIQKKLFQQGFFISAIRPPTVPDQSARIRISLNCMHTESEVTQLLDTLYDSLKNDEQ